MGANVSTVEDSRAAVAAPPATVSHAVFSPAYNYNKNNNNMNWSNNSPENKAVASPSSSSNKSRNHHHHAAALLPSARAPHAHRIISFHSAPSFRGYLEASKASNTLIVIDFINGWCGRCRYMEPTLHEFAAKYTNVEFVKIDVDELFDISREYGVQTTPTFVLIKKGRVIDKVDGARKEELKAKIEKCSVVY